MLTIKKVLAFSKYYCYNKKNKIAILCFNIGEQNE
tara:strand:- start:34198 stop:34302 length:105 start_codon:yes stop_codon:yes gene_type:complete